MSEYGPHVESAMSYVSELDERGLMPLDQARKWVEGAQAFTQADGDLLWAALLSLGDGDEACEVATRWAWRHVPRGRDNIALIERYGEAILPWLQSRVIDGVLVNVPWCVVPCLMEIASVEVLELLWSLRGVRDRVQMQAWTITDDGQAPGDPQAEAAAANELLERWITAYPDIALPWLVERDDERALALLAARAESGGVGFLQALAEQIGEERAEQLFEQHGWPRTLTADHVLAVLDQATERWPEFNYAFDGRQEYHALRLIAAREREGEGWGVVFERLSGSYPQNLFVQRFAYGSGLPPGAEYDDIVTLDDLDIEGPEPEGHLFHGGVIQGPGGELRLDESLIDRWDLRPGKCTEIGYHPMRALAIRTYLAHAPDCLWPPVDDAVAQLGLEDAEALVVSTAFAHVIGPYQREGVPEAHWQIDPSESPTFQSLADALVERDGELFDPGEPNTDWRLHAYVDEPVALPWEFSRISATAFPDRGHLRAAMAEAGVEVDERGCMPLAEARARVAGAEKFTKGEGRAIGELWVQDSDRLWAALLSLADADEFAAAMVRLEWEQQPRGVDTLAPIERYGEATVAWMRARVHEGVLRIEPDCLRANLLALASDAVVDLLVEIEGVQGRGEDPPRVQLDELRTQYFTAHGPLVTARLAARAREHAGARTLLRNWALLDEAMAAGLDEATRVAIDLPAGLSADHVLARLDHHAARPPHEVAAWPRFVHETNPADEFHALRAIAARASGDRWALVLERASGYGGRAAVRRYVYGRGIGEQGHRQDLDRPLVLDFEEDGVHGPGGVLAYEAIPEDAQRLCEAPDYWTGPDGARRSIAALRSHLARWPQIAFEDPEKVIAAIGLEGGEVLLATVEFDHPVDAQLPSQTYRSIAEVIASGDPRRFTPGSSNVDWRKHVRFDPE
jgi:hypothetical protein